MRSSRLSKDMTIEAFDRAYFYASELKRFVTSLGVPGASRMRKDELERVIRLFLTRGALPPTRASPTGDRPDKDSAGPLGPRVRIVRYTNDRTTKDWIIARAQQLDPSFRVRSGAMYRLNRWRESEMAKGAPITYGDLARRYVELCRPEVEYERVETGRYINFLSDFLAGEEAASRDDAIRAWHELKRLDVPKNYRAWRMYQDS